MDTPYFEFLDFLAYVWSEKNAPTIIRVDDLLEKFTKRYRSLYGKREFDKLPKDINQVLKNSLIGLSKIQYLVLNKDIVAHINYQNIGDFTANLRHVKKSKERLARYALFYLFKNGHKEFSINLVEALLQGFEIKNLEKTLENIIKKCQKRKLRISLSNKSISINHEPDDPEIVNIILTELYSLSRKPSGKLEADIINLLEYESLSGKDIALLTGTDKGHVSKTIKKLVEEGPIIATGWMGNARYYMTNCDVCPFGREKDDCHKSTSGYIVDVLKEKFLLSVSEKKFEGVDNHLLRNLERSLKLSTRDAYNKIENPTSQFLSEIFLEITNSIKTKPIEKQNKMAQKLPRNYRLGFEHGRTFGYMLNKDLVNKALSNILKGKELQEANDRYYKLYDKLMKTGKI